MREPTITREHSFEHNGIEVKLVIPSEWIQATRWFWKLRIAYWLVRMVFGKVTTP